MMHKAWSSIGEVPYCFSRSCVKFQGHTGQKIADFDPNWAFPDYNFSLNSPMTLKWCTTLCGIEQVLYCFSKSSIKFQGHTGQKNHQFWSQLSVSGLQLKFDFTDGFEMMHKAWWCLQEVPYCFSRSSIRFHDHTDWKSTIWIQFEITRPVAAIKSLRFALFLYLSHNDKILII